MSEQIQLLFKVFTGFFTQEEMQWLAANLMDRNKGPIDCDHCIEIAMRITQKIGSPIGVQFMEGLQGKVEKGIEEDLAELDSIETEQMAKIQAIIDKRQALLAITQDEEQRQRIAAANELIVQAQKALQDNIASSKRSLKAIKESSRKHLGLLWHVLSQLPGKRN